MQFQFSSGFQLLAAMSQKRIRVRSVTAKVSFVDISPSKCQRRKTCSLKEPVDVLHPPDSYSNSDRTYDWDDVGPSTPVHSADGVSNDTPSLKSYSQRQERACEAWAQIREQMRTTYIESSVPSTGSECTICIQPATVVCKQCGPQVVLCIKCAESQHLVLNLFHRPQLWQV